MGDDEKETRRSDTLERLAVLEEKSHHISKTVDRIEKSLDHHVMEEEAAFHNFQKTKVEMIQMISDFRDDIHDKLDQTVESVGEQVQPIRDEFTKIKTIYKVLTVFGSVILAVVVFFKDNIIRHFS